METVKVSPKFQIVILRKVRESLGIRPGQRMRVFTYQNLIELVPIEPMKKMRGFLAGIDTSVPSD